MKKTGFVQLLSIIVGSVSIVGYAAQLPVPAAGAASVGAMNRMVITGTQQAKIAANDSATLDWLGSSVFLSSNGATAIVGANWGSSFPNNNFGEGAVYVFTRNGTSWSQEAKLTASDGANSIYFGDQVSLSADGNTALVGAWGADNWRGAAYVFARSGTNWSQQARITANDHGNNESFGSSPSLSADGNTAIIGASLYGKAATYVYVRNGTNWSLQTKITLFGDGCDNYFNSSGSLSSDGSIALVGVPGPDNWQGVAYILVRNGTNWSQQAKIVSGDEMEDYFGCSPSLSADGATAIVGAVPGLGHLEEGTAYVFARNGTNWSQQAKLTADDGISQNMFGFPMSLSSDGNIALVGGCGANVNGSVKQGGAYVFARTGTSWSQQAKLTADDGAASNNFGYAAAISSDGGTVLAGLARWVYPKAIYAFDLSSLLAIRINGTQGPVTINAAEKASVTVQLRPGQYTGFDADWWLLVSTPAGWFYQTGGQWLVSSAGVFTPACQGPLGAMGPLEVLNAIGLPAGTYTFYFGVDARDGILDYSGLIYDGIQLVVE